MARIGYARVSSRDQNLDSQIDLLKAAGSERIFEDKISGVKESRPEWDRLLGFWGPPCVYGGFYVKNSPQKTRIVAYQSGLHWTT